MHRDSDLSIPTMFKKRSQFNIDVNYFCECMKAKLGEVLKSGENIKGFKVEKGTSRYFGKK